MNNIHDIIVLHNIFIGNVKYFTAKEVLRGWDVPDDLIKNIYPTILVLDKLRELYNKPIFINSSYRSPAYNKAVKGKPNSMHLLFNALDFTVMEHKDLKKLYNKLNEWDNEPNLFPFLPKAKGNFGLGLYDTFIHLDTRSTLGRKSPVRW